jgi:uncharacterized protein YbaP (TraB family)
MRRFPCAAALVCALLVPAWSQTHEAPHDTLIVTLPAPPPGDGHEPVWQPTLDATGGEAHNGLLWKASWAKHTVYLLGSIHVATRDMYPLPGHIELAFRNSTTLLVEVDVNKMDQGKFQALLMANGMYPPGDSLWNHINADTKRLVVCFCQANGMNPEAFAKLKPWLAALTTAFVPAQMAKQEFVQGLDKYFLDRAAQGMRVEPIESAEYQFRLLASMPEAEQERSLRAALKGAGQGAEDFKQLQSFWLDGDAEKLDASLSSSMQGDPEYSKRVFSDRNPRMADRAEQCLKSGERCFVVVGAGHMVGKDGVVHLLKARGYKVEQVFASQ